MFILCKCFRSSRHGVLLVFLYLSEIDCIKFLFFLKNLICGV